MCSSSKWHIIELPRSAGSLRKTEDRRPVRHGMPVEHSISSVSTVQEAKSKCRLTSTTSVCYFHSWLSTERAPNPSFLIRPFRKPDGRFSRAFWTNAARATGPRGQGSMPGPWFPTNTHPTPGQTCPHLAPRTARGTTCPTESCCDLAVS